MARTLGKNAVVTLDGDALTDYVSSTTFTRTAEALDTTVYGLGAKRYDPGLKDGTVSLEGVYDTTAVTGPGAIIRPLVGAAAVTFVWRPEGTGTTKPEAEVDVIVTSYEESSPAADYVRWTAELQMVEAIDDTPQS